MLVWDMNNEQWVVCKSWMRYCSAYWTKGFDEDFWNDMINLERGL
jgi:hypothetical protein